MVRPRYNDGVVRAAGASGRLNGLLVRQGLLSQAELAWSTSRKLLALGFLFLIQITTPAFVSAPTFTFTFQSHPFPSPIYLLAVCHQQRASILLVCILIDYPSQHTYTTAIMVSHCEQESLHASKQLLTSLRSRNQHTSPTL